MMPTFGAFGLLPAGVDGLYTGFFNCDYATSDDGALAAAVASITSMTETVTGTAVPEDEKPTIVEWKRVTLRRPVTTGEAIRDGTWAERGFATLAFYLGPFRGKQDTEYLVGNKCTYADLMLVPYARALAVIIALEMDTKAHKRYTERLERLYARPAVKKVLKQWDEAITLTREETAH
ncbi:hypothetical protein DL769_000484 [Monosporascus sp. CRB-8-3]|nr:hypothetical protein DL769_000484 [Monosporascus sp. CRB-8-3]